MPDIVTIPHAASILEGMDSLPPEMMASDVPYIVVWRNAMTGKYCDRIVEHFEKEEPYNFPSCGATSTRELPLKDFNQELLLLDSLTRAVNQEYFSYDISDYAHAWMQKYQDEAEYSKHMDQSPGQSRKLTGLLMLTAGDDYIGGEIEFLFGQMEYGIKPTKGDLLVFPGWLIHRVKPVTKGTRKTINLGLWGPPFV